MIPESGEVYQDHVFDTEVTVVKVDEDTMIIDTRGEEREYRRWQWDHNVSVGRFVKKREVDIVHEEETSKDGIFDY